MNVDSLRASCRGAVVTPEDSRYDATRQLWNSMIDRRPAAIACCTGPADVAAAVKFAIEQDIYPAIRAGGHNVAGLASVEGGLVIDVSGMKGITIDPVARTATAQTGLTWGEFDRETQLHGLATTGGVVSTTGIAGLTLGGGLGWLMGRFGMSSDNTLAYELIAADGKWLKASADEHPDLFWALKGGGGNFGVVTSITYRLHPVTTVLGGMLLYPFAAAPEVLRHFRDFCNAGMPDELMVYAGALCLPDGMPVLAIAPVYTGDDLAEGARVTEPLRRFGAPLADVTGPMPYTAMQQMFDAGVPYPIRSYWKSNYFQALTDEAIDTFVTQVGTRVSPRTVVLIEHSHGAIARVAPEATASAQRREQFNLVIVSQWDDAADDSRNKDWTRSFSEAMQPFSARSSYINTLDQDDASRIPQAYGVNQARLAAVKAKYDPQNRFRRNHNILPRFDAAAV